MVERNCGVGSSDMRGDSVGAAYGGATTCDHQWAFAVGTGLRIFRHGMVVCACARPVGENPTTGDSQILSAGSGLRRFWFGWSRNNGD